MRSFFSIIILLTLITAASCVKDQITHPDLLGSPTERVVRVNEGVLIYDSTALNDSLSWVFPPASRLYRWTITPADPEAVFSGLADHGKAEVIFNRSGSYQVSADIYDSLGTHLLGHTNRLNIVVTTDTLHHTERIQPDDTLIIYPTPGHNNTTGTFSMGFWCVTVKDYFINGFYGNFSMSVESGNGLSVVFGDSLSLSSYPFYYGDGKLAPAQGTISVGEFSGPVVVPLTISWLGKTYSGTMSMNSSGTFSFSWDNSGAVRIK